MTDPTTATAPSLRIAAIDDDRLLLDALRFWASQVPDLDLVATDASVAGFLQRGVTVDVVLLDMNLRDHSQLGDNIRQLGRTGAAVVVMSTVPDAEFVIEAIEAGARAYVTKDRDIDALAEAVRTVAAGGVIVSPELAFAFSRDARPSRPRLSSQELEVATLYGRGMPMKSVARRMGIAEGTAKAYLARVKAKYAEAGRPAHTKTEIGQRVREDRLELRGLDLPDDA